MRFCSGFKSGVSCSRCKVFILLKICSFKYRLSLCSDNKGVTSLAISLSSSLVSAECKLKNTADTLFSNTPLNSRASTVFSKVGTSLLLAIASYSICCCLMPSLKAGK